MRVELDHIGTGQTRCADLMVDGGFSHDLARAFASYFARKPCEQVTVVEVISPTRLPQPPRHIAPLDAPRHRPLGGASHCRKAQVIDPIWLLNFAAERYWVQNAMALILAIV